MYGLEMFKESATPAEQQEQYVNTQWKSRKYLPCLLKQQPSDNKKRYKKKEATVNLE